MGISHFIRTDGRDNMPGFYKVQFVPWRKVLDIPQAVDLNVEDDIVLDGDAEWLLGEFVSKSTQYGDQEVESLAGVSRVLEASGYFPNGSPARTFNFSEMRRERYFIVLLYDNNGWVRIIGSLACPAEFSFKESTGNLGSPGGNGYTVSFSSVSKTPALYYQAAADVVSGGVITSLPAFGAIRFAPSTITDAYVEDSRLVNGLTEANIEVKFNTNTLTEGVHYTRDLANNRLLAIAPFKFVSSADIYIKIFYNG